MKTVLSIGAHPDDIEIGCGGTELLLKQKGYSIVHVVVTDGGEGDLRTPSGELARTRRQEAQNSAYVLGAESVIFLGLPDGLTEFSKENKIALISLIRRFQPSIVMTHSSTDHFPDHSLVHKLSVSAIGAAKGPWYPLAGDQAHLVDTVLGYEVWHPINGHQMAVDISTVIEKKLQALGEHRTQLRQVDYLGAIRGLAQYRGVTTMRGSHAEVFEVLKTGEIS